MTDIRKAEMVDRDRWRECGARAAAVGKHRWCGAFDQRKQAWWLEGYDEAIAARESALVRELDEHVVKANDPGVPVFSPGPCWVGR